MMMRGSTCFSLAVVLLAAGCPRNTGNRNATSTSSSSGAASSSAASSSSSSSSAATASTSSAAASSSSSSAAASSSSSSSSAAAAASSSSSGAGSLALDQLCPALVGGMARQVVVASTLLVPELRDDCSPGFNVDGEAVLMQVGDPRMMTRVMCDPDGGSMFQVVQEIGRSSTAGRLVYDPTAAAACMSGGRQYVTATGGLLQFGRGADGGTAILDVMRNCLGVFQGQQSPGEPCAWDVECDSEDAGTRCINRTSVVCEGTCVRAASEGEACDTGDADCAPDLDCAAGRCERPRPLGASCRSDGGTTLPCASGTSCVGDVCSAPATEGQPCGTCAPGLFCEATSNTCVPLLAEGSPCPQLFGGSACQACLACAENPDGGRFCQPFAAVGQSCLDRPCHASAFCHEGVCIARARSQQACVTVADDPSLRGNCLAASDACLGSPPTCQSRAHVGGSCTSRAGRPAEVGSCYDIVESDVRCVRASDTDTQGTCVGPATDNEPCGIQPGLPAACVDGWRCTATQDGGAGRCVPQEGNPVGGYCESSGHCVVTAYCDTSTNTCAAGGGINDPCDSSTAWGNRCAAGHCVSSSGTLRCTAFTGEGGACVNSGECGTALRCLRSDAGTSSCQPRLAAGEACWSDDDCAAGNACEERRCTPAQCVARSDTASCMQPGVLALTLLLGVMLNTRRRRR